MTNQALTQSAAIKLAADAREVVHLIEELGLHVPADKFTAAQRIAFAEARITALLLNVRDARRAIDSFAR